MRRLSGKTAIVTGASRGIGEAIATRLHEEGANLVLVSRGARDGRSLEDRLKQRVTFVEGSVTEPATAQAAIAAAQAAGGVDVLVNNAGIDFTGSLLDTVEADVRRVFETNFFGSLWMLVGVAKELKARGGGSIVNITSRLASIGVPTTSIYAASKGAVLSLTRAAAVEWAPAGIRVNAVAPGLTETAILTEWVSDQPDPEVFRAGLRDQIPQRRFASPKDVAAAVAFLASDDSAHITGATIPVDGGYTAA